MKKYTTKVVEHSHLSYNREVNSLRKNITLILLCASIICTPLYLRAENGIDIQLQSGDISIETIPENPQPYEDVTIKLSSYSTDLSKAFINWRNGSNEILSGYGKTSYSFRAFGPNTTTTFDIDITTGDTGDKVSKRVIISPAEVELMWESVDGYTPPFYRGKSFVSPEGFIRVVAIPNTSTIKSGKGKVSYAWKLNNDTVANASGYNKDSYVFKNDQLDTTEKVTVIASSVDNAYTATKSIEVPIVDPRIIFYKKSPTEGILYNQALANDSFISEDEVTIVAEPYFLATKGNEPSFTYSWTVNGNAIETPSRKTELTVRPSSRGGYATIGVVFENFSSFFQKVSGKLKLNL